MKWSPLLFLPLLACAKAPPSTAPDAGTSGAVAEPVRKAVSAAMDPTADPCQDFYRYACGGWMDSVEIPGDQVRWGRSFSEIRQRNERVIREILERDEGPLGAFYGSCIDEEAADARGAKPIADDLVAVAQLTDLDAVFAHAGKLLGRGPVVLLDYGPFPGFDDPDTTILHIGQGGLGLPDRAYYEPEDEEGQALLTEYGATIERLLRLSSYADEDAGERAAAVLAFEVALAAITTPRDQLRDPTVVWNKLDRSGLEALAPELNWSGFFAGLGYPDLQPINVQVPGYIEQLQGLLQGTDIAVLRDYLAWHLVADAAPELSEDLRGAHFAFFRTRLAGQQERRPRWKTCVDHANSLLGDLVSQAYVGERFAGASKPTAEAMVKGIEQAFEANLAGLRWMDEGTRERAAVKARAVKNKIGYPAKWKDYSDLDLGDGWFENHAAARALEIRRNLDKVGEAVDPDEWLMPASAVNAYYNPLENEIVFPAGILQDPFFDAGFPSAMNYGAIGMVIGHELTHGFDDGGRKFDAEGRMQPWWEDEAAARYEEATACVSDLYAGYEVREGLTVNGQLTLGENIADLGGIKQTHVAWLESEPELRGAKTGIDELTHEQLLFVAFAQSWCSKATPEVEAMLLRTDTHSPARFRVLGPLSQYDGFAQAFACEAGSPMNPAQRCTVW